MRGWRLVTRLSYAPTCAALGLVLGWLPMFVHGPIPAKFTLLYINGPVAVWGFYTARLLIGTAVGLVVWPRPWWLRGPLCGLALMLPVGLIALATPGCGFT
jgi:hypothetical protein